jgi:hypothetical protein
VPLTTGKVTQSASERISRVWRIGLIVIGSFVLLSACSSAPSTGTVEGHFQAVVGHCCFGPRPLPGTIEVTGADGAETSIKVAANGTFQVDLAPGTYTAVGHSARMQSNGQEVARHTLEPVVVRGGATVSAAVDCYLSM